MTKDQVREKARFLCHARSWLARHRVFVGHRSCGQRKELNVAAFSGRFVARLAHMKPEGCIFGNRAEEHSPWLSCILEMMKRSVKKKKGTRKGDTFIPRSQRTRESP